MNEDDESKEVTPNITKFLKSKFGIDESSFNVTARRFYLVIRICMHAFMKRHQMLIQRTTLPRKGKKQSRRNSSLKVQKRGILLQEQY